MITESWDRSVSITTDYRLNGLGLIPDRGKIFLSSKDVTGLLANGYRRLVPLGYSNRGVKLTTHLHLVLRSKMVELQFQSAIQLHGMVLN
jgi:hypothetical protein